MAISKKWSEQSLVKQTVVTHDENGNEVKTEQNALIVCTSGMELYKKHFKNDKYKDKDRLVVPYDFILMGGDMCPLGEFYEVEYFLGKRGAVYRALVQCVNAVTDLPVMLGCLKRNNALPSEFIPIRAWKRDDIDKVSIVSCHKDDDGVPVISGCADFVNGNKWEDGESMTVEEYTKEYPGECCLYYYRDFYCEFWATDTDKDLMTPVFVCGSENVNDPAFADKREADFEEMEDHIQEALQTAQDYNLEYFVLVVKGTPTPDGNRSAILTARLEKTTLMGIIQQLQELVEEK